MLISVQGGSGLGGAPIDEINRYLSTLEIPEYIDTIQLDIYQSSLEVPDYTSLIRLTNDDISRSI
jgi:hypothetical protein